MIISDNSLETKGFIAFPLTNLTSRSPPDIDRLPEPSDIPNDFITPALTSILLPSLGAHPLLKEARRKGDLKGFIKEHKKDKLFKIYLSEIMNPQLVKNSRDEPSEAERNNISYSYS